MEQKGTTGFNTGQLKDLVFSAIGISIVLGGSIFISPNFPIVLGALVKIVEEIKKEQIPKAKIKRVLKTLEKRRLISLDQEGDEVMVRILDSNNIDILRYSIKELLSIKRKKQKWDHKWFLVIFDVPEQEKNKRDYLRRFLTQIGFYQYQKSVYAFPYRCEKEIALVKKIIEGGKYMSYIVADSLEHEDELCVHFQIS
jgi:DNA-binding transcriptional regulator PaaX